MNNMKVCGFTFIKDAIKFDYPVIESITSILPICDKFIVAVGACDDGTRALIESIGSDKLEIIDTVWDQSPGKQGNVLSTEANKAFDAIPDKYDWCFFIHADEVVNEKYLPGIMLSMKKYLNIKEVDGLIMNYTHFYGTFDFYGDSRRWYKSEIRIIKNNKEIRSWYNAQGFRWKNGKKLTGVFIDGMINHYGWVKSPKLMMNKLEGSKEYWASNPKQVIKFEQKSEEFAYEKAIDSLEKFREAHPKVMQSRINAVNWHPALSTKRKKFSVRYFLLYYFEKFFDYRPFEKRHFIEHSEL